MSTALTVTRWRDDRVSLQAKVSGAAKNLAGCSLFFGVRLTSDDPLIIQAAIGAGITITNVAQGRFDVILPALSKIGLSSLVTYYWDVLLVEASGSLITPEGCSGTLTVNESIASGAVVGVMGSTSNSANHPEITGLDGGGATKLDGFDTSTLSVGFIFFVTINGQFQAWQTDTRGAGPEAVDDTSVDPSVRQTVLPDNWNADTNNIVWRRRL